MHQSRKNIVSPFSFTSKFIIKIWGLIIERLVRDWSGALCLAGTRPPSGSHHSRFLLLRNTKEVQTRGRPSSHSRTCVIVEFRFATTNHAAPFHPHICHWCMAFRAAIITQHFLSRLFHISPHNCTTQISNLFLLLWQQFHYPITPVTAPIARTWWKNNFCSFTSPNEELKVEKSPFLSTLLPVYTLALLSAQSTGL